MIPLFPLLLAVSGPPTLPPQETLRRVGACGIPAASLSIAYEKSLGDDAVNVRSDVSPSEDQLRCIAEASLDTGRHVLFRSDDHESAYFAVWLRMGEDRRRRDMASWLREHGYLDKLPQYDATKHDKLAVARQIEQVCGVKPGSVLSWDGRYVGVRSEAVSPSNRRNPSVYCAAIAVVVVGISNGFAGWVADE